MSKVRFLLLAAASLGVTIPAHAQYANAVAAYAPGTGFNPGYTNASVALGEPSRFTPGDFGGPVDPFTAPYLSSQVVSIGADGALTVMFSAPILNHPGNPHGLDFIIFGNAGFMDVNWPNGQADGSLYGQSSPNSTRVSVSPDSVTYYTLNMALAPSVDAYFPTDGSGNFQLPVDPALNAASFAGQNLAGIRALYAGSGGGTGFDIDWAGVPLGSISSIRVEVLSGNTDIDGFSAVPEPATWSLLGLGAVAWAFCPRRRLAKI